MKTKFLTSYCSDIIFTYLTHLSASVTQHNITNCLTYNLFRRSSTNYKKKSVSTKRKKCFQLN